MKCRCEGRCLVTLGCGFDPRDDALDNDRFAAVAKGMALPIETDYATKLFFPNPSFVQVYFEAVANAFDAGADRITIEIVEDPLGVTIRDNGEGLTDERFARFARLMEPADQHHKGVGRLVYLRYFEQVDVVSVFDGKKRSFTFSRTFDGTASTVAAASSEARGTMLVFRGFLGSRLHSKNNDINPAELKRRLLSEFLPLLHDRKLSSHSFGIDINLEARNKTLFSGSQAITTDDVPKLDCRVFRDSSQLFPAEIRMYYSIKRGGNTQVAAACIDGRAIPINNLLSPGAVPADCSYTFLFESDLFAWKTDSARQRLDLPKEIPEAVLYGLFRKQIGTALTEVLPEIAERNASTRQGFEERYPHLTGLFDEDTVGLIDRDTAIDGAQRAFFKAQKEILESDSLDDDTFEKSLEISARTLTEYILYRERIIKKLDAITADNPESDVHDIIVPRRRQFDGGDLASQVYNNNAWLLDDKFMSFRTILSEKRMQDLIAAIAPGESVHDDTRPDISMVFSAEPTTASNVDVVVVELKRRTPDAKESTFAGIQLVQRAIRLANYYRAIQRIWYFAVIEIDDALSLLLKADSYAPLFTRGRHVYYREYPLPREDGHLVLAPVCVLSFDAVIKDAAARNHTFLEILKTAFKKARANAGQPRDPPLATSELAPPRVTRAPVVSAQPPRAPTEVSKNAEAPPRRRGRGDP